MAGIKTFLKVVNNTKVKIVDTKVTNVNDDDFALTAGNPKQTFHNIQVPVNQEVKSEVILAFKRPNVFYTLELVFEDGTSNKFTINQIWVLWADYVGIDTIKTPAEGQVTAEQVNQSTKKKNEHPFVSNLIFDIAGTSAHLKIEKADHVFIFQRKIGEDGIPGLVVGVKEKDKFSSIDEVLKEANTLISGKDYKRTEKWLEESLRNFETTDKAKIRDLLVIVKHALAEIQLHSGMENENGGKEAEAGKNFQDAEKYARDASEHASEKNKKDFQKKYLEKISYKIAGNNYFNQGIAHQGKVIELIKVFNQNQDHNVVNEISENIRKALDSFNKAKRHFEEAAKIEGAFRGSVEFVSGIIEKFQPYLKKAEEKKLDLLLRKVEFEDQEAGNLWEGQEKWSIY